MQQEMQAKKTHVNYTLFSVQTLHICMCSSLSDCIHMDLMVIFSAVSASRLFIENKNRKTVLEAKDSNGRETESEKIMEIVEKKWPEGKMHRQN